MLSAKIRPINPHLNEQCYTSFYQITTRIHSANKNGHQTNQPRRARETERERDLTFFYFYHGFLLLSYSVFLSLEHHSRNWIQAKIVLCYICDFTRVFLTESQTLIQSHQNARGVQIFQSAHIDFCQFSHDVFLGLAETFATTILDFSRSFLPL